MAAFVSCCKCLLSSLMTDEFGLAFSPNELVTKLLLSLVQLHIWYLVDNLNWIGSLIKLSLVFFMMLIKHSCSVHAFWVSIMQHLLWDSFSFWNRNHLQSHCAVDMCKGVKWFSGEYHWSLQALRFVSLMWHVLLDASVW